MHQLEDIDDIIRLSALRPQVIFKHSGAGAEFPDTVGIGAQPGYAISVGQTAHQTFGNMQVQTGIGRRNGVGQVAHIEPAHIRLA